MSDDLVEWLRAQLLIDEEKALATSPVGDRVWRVAGETGLAQGSWTILQPHHGQQSLGSHAVAHIANWDPSRVLREVEAKRRRLDRHHPVVADDTDWVACSHCHTTYPCADIRDDLAVYSDRPGYRKEWRPA